MNPARLASDREFDAIHGSAGGKFAEEETGLLGVEDEHVARPLGHRNPGRETLLKSSFPSSVSIGLRNAHVTVTEHIEAHARNS